MKVLIIGATGHIGSYLVKQLVPLGHEVYALSRGERKPFGYDKEIWDKVKMIKSSREDLVKSDLIETERFDAVCDLMSFAVEDVKALTDKLTHGEFFLHIGSIWTYENKLYLPVDEKHPHNSESWYGKGKGDIEDYLLDLSKKGVLKCAVVHPGHISGKEWTPINPQGNLDATVYKKIMHGEEIILPFYGLPTLQHVHAHDLSAVIVACLTKPEKANGHAFISVAEHAMTLRAIAEELFRRFGHEPKIKYVGEQEFLELVGKDQYEVSMDHITHSPCCTCAKSIEFLGVKPKYTIIDIICEYLEYQYE